jgi:NitT/TauT family transport system permease protein
VCAHRPESHMAVNAAVSMPVDEEALRRREVDRAVARRRRAALLVTSWRLVVLAALLLGWTYASGRLVSSLFLSDPLAVARAFRDDLTSGELLRNAQTTVKELLVGYGIGAAAALATAGIVSLSSALQRVLRPYLIAFYAIPKVALAPLMVMWFGLGFVPKVVLAAIFVYFVVFMSTLGGLQSVAKGLVDTARVMGANRLQLMVKIVFPTAVPNIVTALRIAIPGAMAGAIIGEFIAATNGLGYMVNSAASQFATASVFSAIVAILVIVLVCDALLALVERKLLRWRPQRTATGARL